jgi:hypothetical protein
MGVYGIVLNNFDPISQIHSSGIFDILARCYSRRDLTVKENTRQKVMVGKLCLEIRRRVPAVPQIWLGFLKSALNLLNVLPGEISLFLRGK